MTLPSPSWEAGPILAARQRGVVDIWRADLRPASALVGQRAWPVSQDERVRAARFTFALDRRRFLAARSMCRIVLGRYLRVAPELVRFTYGHYGKPAVARPCGDGPAGLAFSLTHAREFALLAVTGGCAVGIDVEQVRPLPEAGDIAASMFAPTERAALEACAACGTDAWLSAFFRVWVRKEAYLKATGIGLASGLAHFAVPVEAASTDALVPARPRAGETRHWSQRTFCPAPGYIAAVVARGRDWAPRFWEFEPDGSSSPMGVRARWEFEPDGSSSPMGGRARPRMGPMPVPSPCLGASRRI